MYNNTAVFYQKVGPCSDLGAGRVAGGVWEVSRNMAGHGGGAAWRDVRSQERVRGPRDSGTLAGAPGDWGSCLLSRPRNGPLPRRVEEGVAGQIPQANLTERVLTRELAVSSAEACSVYPLPLWAGTPRECSC